MGYASAIAVVLFVAVLTLTVLQLAARRWWVYEGEGADADELTFRAWHAWVS